MAEQAKLGLAKFHSPNHCTGIRAHVIPSKTRKWWRESRTSHDNKRHQIKYIWQLICFYYMTLMYDPLFITQTNKNTQTSLCSNANILIHTHYREI